MKSLFSAKLLVLAGAFLLSAASDGRAADEKAEKLWKSKCASCHGMDGKGETKQGKKNKVKDMTQPDYWKEMTDEKMMESMVKGIDREHEGTKQKMDSFKGKLDDAQMKSLIEFAKQWKK